MSTKKQLGPSFVSQIFPQLTQVAGNRKQIYINDRITTYNLNILKKLAEIKSKKIITYSWYRFGNIYAKINKDDNQMLIKSVDDVTRINNDSSQNSNNIIEPATEE